MAGTESRLKVRQDGGAGGVIQVQFRDRNILDEANIQQIGEEIRAIIEKEPKPRLLIDFKDVDHLSSAALGTLIIINNKLKTLDGQLRLCNIDPQIYQVFVITKLNKIFDIHETAEKATASFR
ncbi:MAG: STAS domain-containing protein [Phycisphaerales bacterium]